VCCRVCCRGGRSPTAQPQDDVAGAFAGAAPGGVAADGDAGRDAGVVLSIEELSQRSAHPANITQMPQACSKCFHTQILFQIEEP